MKNLLSLLLILLTISCSPDIFAQRLMVSDATLMHDDSERPCVQVIIEPDTKAIKDNIKDWMKDKHDVELKGFGFLTNKDVLSAKQASLPAVSPNQLDFFVKVVEEGDYSKMCVFASLGYSIHISPEAYPKEYQALKTMTLDFISDFLSEWYLNRLEEAQEVVKELEEERSELNEDITENKKDIEDLREENEEISEELKEKKVELKEAIETVEDKKLQLKKVTKKLKKSRAKEGNN